MHYYLFMLLSAINMTSQKKLCLSTTGQLKINVVLTSLCICHLRVHNATHAWSNISRSAPASEETSGFQKTSFICLKGKKLEDKTNDVSCSKEQILVSNYSRIWLGSVKLMIMSANRPAMFVFIYSGWLNHN